MVDILFMQNGKLLRSLKPHAVAVVCLNWEEDGQSNTVCFSFDLLDKNSCLVHIKGYSFHIC